MSKPANDTVLPMNAQTCEVVYDDALLRQYGVAGLIDLAVDSLKGMAEVGARHLVLIIRPRD